MPFATANWENLSITTWDNVSVDTWDNSIPAGTFPQPRNPNIGGKVDYNPRSLVATFGDGFNQRAIDGINVLRETWDVGWDCADQAEAATMRDFLQNLAGAGSFTWTPPGESTPKKFISKTYGIVKRLPTADTFTATFERVFDL